MLRRSKTVDWQKRSSARAKMRMMVKRLLKKYKYPPDGQEEALKTVMSQCEMWTDNADLAVSDEGGDDAEKCWCSGYKTKKDDRKKA